MILQSSWRSFGNRNYVTSEIVKPTQIFLTLTFGETMEQQQEPTVYFNPYKFNAKELDSETGLYYYVARYYNPRISIWYGVAPLAEEYPEWSPYVYGKNAPITHIDPDGKEALRWPPTSKWQPMTSYDLSKVYTQNTDKRFERVYRTSLRANVTTAQITSGIYLKTQDGKNSN